MAKEFVPNPEEKAQVDHLDHNRSNNRKTNLEWVSAKENSGRRLNANHRTKGRAIVQLTLEGEQVREWESTKAAAAAVGVTRGQIQACLRGRQGTSRGFRWEYKAAEADPQERWRKIEERGVRWEVSSQGRVKLPRSGTITRGNLTHDGYREVVVDGGHYKLHRLVALAFLPKDEDRPIVNHIDSDRQNNALSNLEWVSHKENTQHAVSQGKMRVTPVQAIIDGELRKFGSIAEAAKATGIGQQNISRCVRCGKTAGGYEWARSGEPSAGRAQNGNAAMTPSEEPSLGATTGTIIEGPGSDAPAGVSGEESRSGTAIGAIDGETLLGAHIADIDPLWAELGLG